MTARFLPEIAAAAANLILTMEGIATLRQQPAIAAATRRASIALEQAAQHIPDATPPVRIDIHRADGAIITMHITNMHARHDATRDSRTAQPGIEFPNERRQDAIDRKRAAAAAKKADPAATTSDSRDDDAPPADPVPAIPFA